jgi:hypothetical protein
MTRFLALRISHSLARLLLLLTLAGCSAVSAWGSPDAHATGLPSTMPPHNRCTAEPTIQVTWIRSGVLSVSGRCFTPGGAVLVEAIAGISVLMVYSPVVATRGHRVCSRGTCYDTGGQISCSDTVDDSYSMMVVATDLTTYRHSNIVTLNPHQG